MSKNKNYNKFLFGLLKDFLAFCESTIFNILFIESGYKFINIGNYFDKRR
jgi:hypothetical protein